MAEKVHKAYCAQYEKDNGKPYWTNGDYSKLDEKAKEYDRVMVRLFRQELDLARRDGRNEAVEYVLKADLPHLDIAGGGVCVDAGALFTALNLARNL